MRRPSHATVVAYVALFVALTGGAYAISLARNSVKAKQIAPDAVRSSEVKADAVGNSELAPGAVAGAEVQDRSLGATKLQEGSLTETEIQDRSLGAAEIKQGALTGAEIGDESLTGSDIDESTLGGVPLSPQVMQFGGTIPSGTTLIGGWGVQDTSSAGGAKGYDTINFPVPAPASLTDADVNVTASSGFAVDDDASCTGNAAEPTALPGKVCIYPDTGAAAANSVEGVTFATSSVVPGPIKRAGFMVRSMDASTLSLSGTWAYTAP